MNDYMALDNANDDNKDDGISPFLTISLADQLLPTTDKEEEEVKEEDTNSMKGHTSSYLELQLPDMSSVSHISDQYYEQLVSSHSKQGTSTCSNLNCKHHPDGPLYLCSTCFGNKPYCQHCIKEQHQSLPFHRILVWDDTCCCYISANWTDLNMAWTLVHKDGKQCTSEGRVRRLQVLHVNGMHILPYHVCNCFIGGEKRASASPLQLLANNLFPATSLSPTSSFSFEVMELFDSLNLNGFINIKQFCDSLIELTPRDMLYNDEV